MTRAMTRGGCVASLLGFSALLSSCAAFVDKTDYADYRQVRLAPSEDERLLAAQRYVAAHPDGHWHDELAAEQSAREVVVYERGKATREGLQFYVAAYPEGRFSVQAQQRLAVIAQVEARKTEERAEAERVREDRRVRDEELRRTWVTRFFGYWADTLLAVRQWGEPIGDIARQNPDFSRAFGKSPRPKCNASECVKHYRANYGVPVPGGTRMERSIELLLRLSLREGRVTSVELLFPRRGFSRWFELENRRPVIDEDPQMRAEAIAWAFEKVKPTLAKIGDDAVEVAGLVFEAVQAPTLGPDGEVTDTAANDPSSQVIGGAQEQSMGEQPALGTPTEEQPAPDMVIGPIVIPEQGNRVITTPAPAPTSPATEGASGEVMTLGIIDVGPSAEAGPSGAAGPTAGEGEVMTLGPIDVGGGSDVAPSEPAPAVAQTLQAQTYTLRSGDLRVTVFAETPGGWDGVRIDRVPAPTAKPRPRQSR